MSLSVFPVAIRSRISSCRVVTCTPLLSIPIALTETLVARGRGVYPPNGGKNRRSEEENGGATPGSALENSQPGGRRHGRRAVLHGEPHQQVLDVGLDRGLAKVELPSDHGVRVAGRNQA